MSLEAFWLHFPSSWGLFPLGSVVNSPRLDSEAIEAILDDSDYWLMHGSVKGYEPEDFAFLADDERGRLATGVKQYRAILPKARSGEEISGEERAQARSGFRAILEVIRPDKYAGIDAFVVGKKIENLVSGELPGWVREMVFETGPDSSGAPGLWIWVEVEDHATLDRSFHDEFSSISEVLRRAAAEVCPERWAYIRLRTVSEQRPKESRRPKARTRKR